MRALSLIREALLVLLSSAGVALLLFVCAQEIRRPAGVNDATFGGIIPITASKSPWWLLVALVLLAVWFTAREMGKPQGLLWGIWRWGVRAAFWWSGVALLLLVGVVLHGTRTRSIAELNWQFALVYLAVLIVVLVASGIGRVRSR